MKYVLMFAVALTLAGTASAQRSGSSSGGLNYGGGGGAGGGSVNSGSTQLLHVPPTVFTQVTASGDASWVPSTILPWADAVALGKPKPEVSLGDAAREYRKQKGKK